MQRNPKPARRSPLFPALAGVLILLLPLITLLAAAGRARFGPAPTPAYGPGPDAQCPHVSPDGRFCTVVADFGGVTVQAADGRRLDWPLWKWSRFLGWTDDSRFAFVDNYDQYGNHAGLVVDTALWDIWRLQQDGDDVCIPSMSGNCRGGFALIAPAADWVLQESGVLTDLRARTGRSLFPAGEALFVWPADLGPDGRAIALFAGPLSSLASSTFQATLYLAQADEGQARPVAGLTLPAALLSGTAFAWQNGGTDLRITTAEHDSYVVDVATGRWVRAAP